MQITLIREETEKYITGKAKPAGQEPSAPKQPPEPSALRGWYGRGYLPYFDAGKTVQFITFRLADSLPQSKLRHLEKELSHLSQASCEVLKRQTIEEWLDAGVGCNALMHPKVAAFVEATLRQADGKHYRLLAWCIMPNHVHVIVEPKIPMAKIVKSWKSLTGRWAMERNARLGLGIPGNRLWMRDCWDRTIQTGEQYQQVVQYIHENPVEAGLCLTPREWPWSSAKYENGELGHLRH
jgi:REP element-mobilizing transposase RayT